jgi:hypothetical protein
VSIDASDLPAYANGQPLNRLAVDGCLPVLSLAELDAKTAVVAHRPACGVEGIDHCEVQFARLDRLDHRPEVANRGRFCPPHVKLLRLRCLDRLKRRVTAAMPELDEPKGGRCSAYRAGMSSPSDRLAARRPRPLEVPQRAAEVVYPALERIKLDAACWGVASPRRVRFPLCKRLPEFR